jgi:hypothetical protein
MARAAGTSLPVDPHRIAEARSLAYHRAVAARLIAEPALVEQARARVQDWLATAPDAHYAKAWSEVLGWSTAEIVTFLIDDGERATELRQSTPFAGVLDPRERWRIWREVGARVRTGA